MPKPRENKQKKVAPALRIYCEGAKTEPYYIKGYINTFHSNARSIIIVEDTNKNTPVQLVKTAIAAKKSTESNDIFWVVYDRESPSKYSDKLHQEARKTAKDNGIEIAFSNVCFEYWLLLHFSYTTASYNSCDDLIKKSKLNDYLKSVGIHDYDKADPCIFYKLKEKVRDAIDNAIKLKKEATKTSEGNFIPCKINPYIDFHELLIDMNNFISGNVSIRHSI
jgi:hypothetical protein